MFRVFSASCVSVNLNMVVLKVMKLLRSANDLDSRASYSPRNAVQDRHTQLVLSSRTNRTLFWYTSDLESGTSGYYRRRHGARSNN